MLVVTQIAIFVLIHPFSKLKYWRILEKSKQTVITF